MFCLQVMLQFFWHSTLKFKTIYKNQPLAKINEQSDTSRGDARQRPTDYEV